MENEGRTRRWGEEWKNLESMSLIEREERERRETLGRGSKSFQGWSRVRSVLVNEKLQRVGVKKIKDKKKRGYEVLSGVA